MRVGFRCGAVALLVSAAAPGLASLLGRAEPAPEGYLRITVTTPLPAGRVPLDPEVDFTALRRRLGLPGVLDPDSVRVTDGETGRAIPHALSDEFQFGDRGRVEWSALRPSQRVFDLRFRTVPLRPAPRARGLSLPIGVGDLLRYGGGQRRPLALPYLSRLVDLTGDGRADLVGCWNYAHRPGRPWDGIFCFPRRPGARYEFGDPIRLRHAVGEDSTTLEEFSSIYMQADLADLDGDRRPDLVYSPRRGSRLELFRNTGRRDAGGMPIFAPAGTLPRPEGAWEPCRAVDLNGDGAVDLVVGDWYLQNSGAPGWPLRTAAPVALGAGPRACFLDLDQDERLDAVSLEETGRPGEPQGHRVVWRRNEGAASPRFSEARPLAGVDPFWCSDLAATTEGNQPVLLVQHKVFQEVSLYTPGPPRAGEPVLRRLGRAESRNTLLALSDQAWPCVCDWNDDGRLDLLVGGGYGWPRILLNRGTSTAPRYTEPQPILSEGRPIRLLMAEIF
ncbi:MAG: VCBS repeat-containing protein, partial [Armatimonadetes bacterium]|nr:VCBS repeat-containing protein [Armatimonadota bacterium]